MKSILLIIFCLISFHVFSDDFNKSIDYLNSILSLKDNINTYQNDNITSLNYDPANFILYAKIESHIRALDKIISGNSDMLSYYTCMDGVLSEIINNLQKIRELLIQKGNPVYSDFNKEIIDNEVKQNYRQINYLLIEAEFNKIKLFSELLKSMNELNYFNQEKFYDLSNVDRLLNFIIREEALIGILSNRIEHRINSDTNNSQNSGTSLEINTLRKNSLIFIIKLLML